MIKQAENDS